MSPKESRKITQTTIKFDFIKTFTTPTVYIFFAACLVLPVLILVMTTALGSGEKAGDFTFTNVWQAIGSAPNAEAASAMDVTSMCNINLLYFLSAIFVCIMIGEDFKSGYAKNLFAVRPKKLGYIISKIAVGFTASAVMLALYLVGAAVGGKIAGLSFSAAQIGASAGGIALCMLCKIFISLIFTSIAAVISTFGRQRLWISVLGSLAACALLFAVIPVMSPLNSGAVNALMCAAGGVLIAVGCAALGSFTLNKFSLV